MPCTIPSETLARVAQFHGHVCPGLTIGIRAAEYALAHFGHASDCDLVCVTEADMCGVDAIQFLTGCTFGKGNLIHKDYGKIAFSFFRRNDGVGARLLLRPDAGGAIDVELGPLMHKLSDGTASEADKTRANELREQMRLRYLAIEPEAMFDIRPLHMGAPRPAKILDSLVCEACGERTMESRTRRFAGQTLCIPCFLEREQKI